MITFRNINKYNYDAVSLLDPGKDNSKYILPNSTLLLSTYNDSIFLEMIVSPHIIKIINFY